MNCKKLIISVFMLAMLSLTITYSAVAGSTSEETRTVYHLEYGGLIVEVDAPYKADPGENINITVRINAPLGKVNVNYIALNIYGLKHETNETLLGSIRITDLEGAYASNETREYIYEITLLEDISPGSTYGTLSYEWDFTDIRLKIPSAGFIVTYVKNKEIEQLSAAYEQLNASYWELSANYTELESKYKASSGQLGGTRNLMYAFVATTIVSVATAVLLVIRRPKREPFL